MATLVQEANVAVGPGANNVTATLAAATTPGNLLILAVGCDKQGTYTVSDNFPNQPVALTGLSTSLHVFWKVADGTEQSVVATRNANSASGDNVWYAEYSDTGPSAWELVASSTANGGETDVASLSTGSTGIIPGDGFVQGFAFASNDSHNGGTASWTNSYVAIRNTQLGATGAGGLWVSGRTVSTGVSTSTTPTISSGVDQMHAAVLVFAQPASVIADGYILQEDDTSKILLEDGTGALVGEAYEPPTGQNEVGTATLTGSGSLSTAGVPAIGRTVALSGSGTLAAAGAPAAAGAAGLSGSGTLATTQTPRPAQTVALSGAGTLSTTGVTGYRGTATLSGSGTLATAGQPGVSQTANLSGTGALNTTPSPAIARVTALSGSGQLSTTGALSTGVQATLAGSGSLAAGGAPVAATSAALSGAGSLSTTAALAVSAVAALTGVGQLATLGGTGGYSTGYTAGYGSPTFLATATLSGSGALTVVGKPGLPGVAALSGSGTITVGGKPGPAAAVALSGAGTLTTTQTPRPTGAAALSGTGTLTSAQTPRPAPAAALTGSGTLATAAVLTVAGTATLSGAGTLVAFAAGQTFADFSGSGTLTAAGALAVSRTAILSGSGTLTAAAVPALVAGAALSGSGLLTAAGVARYSVAAALSGSGLLEVASKLGATSGAALSGIGVLTATAGNIGTVTLEGSGTLLVAWYVRLVQGGGFAGDGDLYAEGVAYERPRPQPGPGARWQVGGEPQISLGGGTLVLDGPGSLRVGAERTPEVVTVIQGDSLANQLQSSLLDDDVAGPTVEEVRSVAQDQLLYDFTIRNRVPNGTDDDGNPKYSWVDSFSGLALEYEMRTEVNDRTGTSVVRCWVVMNNVGNVPIEEKAVAVDTTNGVVWRILWNSDLPGQSRLHLERLDA